jgi:hypothetical protein
VPLETRVAKLEGFATMTGRVMRENAQHIGHAFNLQDSHIAVMYRVLNDLYREQVYGVDGDIDLQRYHVEFGATMIVTGLLEKLGKAAEAEKNPAPVPEAPQPTGDMISLPDFGGTDASP